jgi:hypothetical protein
MLISVPLFASNTYMEDNSSQTVPLQMLYAFDAGSDGFTELFNTFVTR